MAEKNNPPSARKLAESRKNGRVWRANMLIQAIGFIMLICMAISFKTMVLEALHNLIELQLAPPTIGEALSKTAFIGFGFVLVVLSAVAVVCSTISCAFGGFVMSSKPITLQFERLNAAAGLRRLANGIKDGWQLLLRMTIAMLIMGVVTFQSILSRDPFSALNHEILVAGVLLVGLGLFDALMKYRGFINDLKMTDEEVRREMKDSEGDPLLRAMQRSMRESLSRSEVVKRLKRAKVVVVRRSASEHT